MFVFSHGLLLFCGASDCLLATAQLRCGPSEGRRLHRASRSASPCPDAEVASLLLRIGRFYWGLFNFLPLAVSCKRFWDFSCLQVIVVSAGIATDVVCCFSSVFLLNFTCFSRTFLWEPIFLAFVIGC